VRSRTRHTGGRVALVGVLLRFFTNARIIRG
jgi:hypothetical protein